MSRSRAGLVAIAGVLLVVSLGYLASQLSFYQETVEQGPAPQARNNPYLAAERFLVEQGKSVSLPARLDGVLDNAPNDQILLLLADRAEMTPDQSTDLLEWVGAGGHLVFVAERLWDEQAGQSGDLLLDALDLQQYETEDDPGKAADAAGQAGSVDNRATLTRLYLEGDTEPAYLAFDTRYHLYDAGKKAHAWANSDGATHMLQLQHGKGLVTALTDSWIWQNDAIGQHDHAWLLWYLTQDRNVTLLHHAEHDSLLQQLLRHFPQALTALLLALLFTVWHRAARHGPIIVPADRGRRQLQEHLRASADFLYRHAGQRQLLDTLQQDIQRQARRHHPGFDALGHTEQCRALAALSRLPIDAVDKALRPTAAGPANATEFTHLIASLQRLRNAL